MNRLVLLYFFGYLGLVFGQTDSIISRQVDSLYAVNSKEKDDSLKIENLKKVDELIWKSDRDQSAKVMKAIDSIADRKLKSPLTLQQRQYFLKQKGTALKNIGLYYFRTNLQLAEEYYQKSLRTFTTLSDSLEIGLLHLNMGDYYHRASDYQKSLQQYRAAMSIFKNGPYVEWESKCYEGFGANHSRLANYDSALVYFNQGLEYSRKNNFEKGVEKITYNIGIIHARRGDFAKAFEMFNTSLEIARRNKDEYSIGNYTQAVGNVYAAQGNYEKAAYHFEESLESKRKIGDFNGQANALFNLAGIYDLFRDFDKSADCYQEALKIYKLLGSERGTIAVTNGIGINFVNRGLFEEAISPFTESIAFYRKSGERESLAHNLSNLGITYNYLGQFDSADVYLSEALKIAQEIKSEKEVRIAGTGLFNTYRLTKKYDLAREHIGIVLDLREVSLKTNFPILSEGEKELYIKTLLSTYYEYYDYVVERSSVEPDLTDRAYNNALQLKGLLLKSSTAMRLAILESKDSTLISDFNQWIEIKREIARVLARGGDYQKLEKQANELERKLARRSSEFADVQRNVSIDWKEVQSKLKNDECAIEMINYTVESGTVKDPVREHIYAALIIRPDYDHPRIVRLFEEKELQEIIGTFPGNNQSYIDQIYGTEDNTKSQLYDLIWKPLEPELNGVRKVIVSPTALLHKISFSALSKSQGVVLCDQYEIDMKTSTSKLALSDKVVINNKSNATIFGGIEYNSDSTSTEIWNYLEGTLSESKKIEKILLKAEWKVNSYRLKDATEDKFKEIASNSNIMHIATHGYFYADPELMLESSIDNEETQQGLVFRGGNTGMGVQTFVKSKNPLMRSGLVFAGANDVWSYESVDGEDGVLTANEVGTMDLRKTNLVVLSACETGLGDIVRSEGVYGLQRAFKVAGVNYLIMSLWQVPDKATSEFMTEFYKNLIDVNDVETAFRKAQTTMRQKYGPYYWAAFVLME